MTQKYNNIPSERKPSSSDLTVKVFDEYYSKPIEINNNELIAITAFFETRGFSPQSSESTAITIMKQAKRDGYSAMQVLDTLKTLNGSDINSLIFELMNFNRYKSSALGKSNVIPRSVEVSRQIPDSNRVIKVSGPTPIADFYGTIIDCEPYSVDVYPWSTFPQLTDLTTYFNDPAKDGVTFNMNLGGYEDSWKGSEVYTALGLHEIATYPYVEFGTYNPSNSTITLNKRNFTITNSIQVERYSKVGGSTDGVYNVTPGVHTYPGVAALGTWANGYIQVRDYGYPVWYEQWFSLNMDRTSPSMGYNNYTFFPDTLIKLGIDLTNINSSRIDKVIFGIFKASADITNPLPSDIIMGSILDNGTITLYANGVVTDTADLPFTARQATFEIDPVTLNTISELGTKKTFIRFNTVDLFDGYEEGTVLTSTFPWPSEDLTTQGLIDTYQVKFGWYVDTYKSIRNGMWETNEVIWCEPAAMAAQPDAILPCSPANPQPPNAATL